MDVEDVLFGGSVEYAVRVIGLVSFLLHCNASNQVLEILKHDKIWQGKICIRVSQSQILGDSSPCSPVIYAHNSLDDAMVCTNKVTVFRLNVVRLDLEPLMHHQQYSDWSA